MNTTDILKRESGAPDSPEFVRTAAQLLFPIHTLQHLDRDEITRCQHLLRHGNTFGVWVSPRGWVQRNCMTRIDLRQRILSFLLFPVRLGHSFMRPSRTMSKEGELNRYLSSSMKRCFGSRVMRCFAAWARLECGAARADRWTYLL